ncbi:MAG: family 10 glycosylhydrolase [Lentisphaerae bacterium]|nr:family 10 glycosylhydrolase [Lentisphaerota bacterium]
MKTSNTIRRISMNNDGNDCRNPKPDEPKTVEHFLSKRTEPLVGSQVDSIFYCDGVFNSYTHTSDETELRGRGDVRGVDWAWELAEQGHDALAIMADFGRRHGIEVFWSMRMNDTHDSQAKALLCKWKQEHPDYLMGKKGDSFPKAGRWSAVNYGLPEVREKVFRIFRDVCTRFDVDGIELDFFRHPVCFKPQLIGEPVTQAHCDMMTGLLQRVRRMADAVAAKRGRPLLIAVRVPDSAGYCKAMGLDIERWLADGLIDLMVVTCYFQLNAWEESVQLGHNYGVPVYPALSESRIAGEAGKVRNSLEAYRARAMNVWHSGADGVYLFNCDNPRTPLWRELGDPAALEKLDKVYAVSFQGVNGYSDPEWWLAGGGKFAGLPRLSPDSPLAFTPGGKKTVTLTVGEHVRQAELKLRLHLVKATHGAALTVTLNDRALGNGTLADDWLEFRPDPDMINKGANRIEIESRVELVVQDLLLWVSHKRQ